MRYAISFIVFTLVASLSMIVASAKAEAPVTGAPARPAPGTAKTSTGGTMATPDDPQVAGILDAANQAEIEGAKLAQVHAFHREVKSFARKMAFEHREEQRKAKAIINKENIKPQVNETSTSILSSQKQLADQLSGLKGAQFDKTYLQAEIDRHNRLLETIDSQLYPNAKSAELKTYLQALRPKIEAHLNQAKTLEAKLVK